jgi:hypothetical protein
MYAEELHRICNEDTELNFGDGAGAASPQAVTIDETRLSSPANVCNI